MAVRADFGKHPVHEWRFGFRVRLAIQAELLCKPEFECGVLRGKRWVLAQGVTKAEPLFPQRACEWHQMQMVCSKMR